MYKGSETSFVSSSSSTILSVQGGILVSPPISSASGVGVKFVAPYPTPYSLWSIPSIPHFPSLEKSTVGQPMITSQPSMSGVQSGIGPNPMANIESRFNPLLAFL